VTTVTVTVTLSVDSRASTSTATTVEQRRRNLRISPRIRIGVLAHAEDCARVARSTDVRRRPRLESTGSPPLSRADDEEERINDASTMVSQVARTHVHGSSCCCLRPSKASPRSRAGRSNRLRAAFWAGAVRSALVPTRRTFAWLANRAVPSAAPRCYSWGHESVGYRRRWFRRPKRGPGARLTGPRRSDTVPPRGCFGVRRAAAI
jgi:hypothetical protein